MNNTFFTAALGKASLIMGKPGRLIMLVAKLTSRLRSVDWKRVKAAGIRERFNVLGRLIRAYAAGQYREIPWKTVLIVVAAVVYFLNPLDLVPDLVPLLGFTDDFGILIWVYRSVSGEIAKFLAWEKSRVTVL